MFKQIDFRSGCRLEAGYYLLEAGPQPLPRGLEARFEREDGQGGIGIPLGEGGALLVRLRAPLKNVIDGLPPGFSGPFPLRHLKLSPAAAVLAKWAGRRRLKLKIGMPDGSGYVCVLGGIGSNELARLSRCATVQRSLWPLGLDDRSISSPELFDNPLQWMRPAEKLPAPPSMDKIAVVLHLYYADLWAEFGAFLSQIEYPFDLWITHCGMDGALRAQILQRFPQAQIVQVENRGRDIWPFISLLNDGALESYSYICKIHSKKSAHSDGEEESLLGSRWRRRALYDLLAAGRAAQIVDMFGRDPGLGMVGPRALRIPSARYTAKMAWGTDKNRKLTLRLARRMGAQMSEADIGFFAGSMFWMRPEAMEPLRRLNLRRVDFPDEGGQLNGELQHAIERLFSISVLLSNSTISDIGPAGFVR